MDSIKASFYFSDKKEASLFKFMKQKVEVAAASDNTKVDIVVKTIDKLSEDNEQKDCIVVPFCTKSLDSFVGLKKAQEYRKTGDYKTPFLFITYNKLILPDFLNPHTIESPQIKSLLGNPRFGEVEKAILLAETFFDAKKNELKNFVLLSTEDDFFQDFLLKLRWTQKYKTEENEEARRIFYDTFINYYLYTVDGARVEEKEEINKLRIEDLDKLQDPSREDNIKEFKDELRKNDKNEILKNKTFKVYDVLELADYIHCLLSGLQIPQKKGTHNIPLELFRAPVPFPLQELFDAKLEIEYELREGDNRNNIRLLLVDNKLDKVVVKDGYDDFYEGELIRVLFDWQYCSMFELRMLGDVLLNSISQRMELPRDLAEYKELMESECFNFREFERSLDDFKSMQGDVSEEEKTKNYAWRIYDKIKSSHFVLLDFFLNTENTYLAFKFIKDIADIKKKEGDTSTTWYFTTSAVYDSVVKYSQSGLLAEYFESAVVNAGDDPTNKNRQIIFVYKLLTFIQARIRSFKGFHDSIVDSKLLNCENEKCKDTRCLIENQNLFRKYLAEYYEIINIFPGQEESEKYFKETVELLDSTVNQFIWLPEADWPMIQRQIEHINSRLHSIREFKMDKRQFSCRYIQEEIKKRSEIY